MMLHEIGGDNEHEEVEQMSKAALQKARAELKALLDTPIEAALQGKSYVQKGPSQAVSKKVGKKKAQMMALKEQAQQDWRRRKNGFFVYTPN